MNRTKLTFVLAVFCVLAAFLLVFARPKIDALKVAALTPRDVPRAVESATTPEDDEDLYRLTPGQKALFRESQERAAATAAKAAKEGRAPLVPTVVGGAWVPLGPAPAINGQLAVPPDSRISGAVKAIAVHPTDPNIIYLAAAGGGIWRTANATAANPTWTPLLDAQPAISMGSIEFDPTDNTHQTLVACSTFTTSYGGLGALRLGVLRTTDGGNTWTRLGVNTFVNEGLLKHRFDAGSVLLTCSNNAQGGGNASGLFRSPDTGATWTLLSGAGGSGLPGGPVTKIIGDPLVPTRFYAACRYAGVYRSDDSGATWTNISGTITGIASTNNIKIEMTLHHTGADEVMYVGVIRDDGPPNNAALKFVWRSLNPSTAPSFTAMDFATGHNGGQGTVHFGLVAHPTNPNLVYMAGDRDLNSGGSNVQLGDASQPAGSQWISLCRENANNTAPHPDCRVLQFDLNGNLLEGDDGGIYRRSSPTLTTGIWSSVVGNLGVFEATGVAYDSTAHVAMIGAQDNGCLIKSAPNSMVWNWVSGGDGGDVAIDDTSEPGFSYRYGASQYLGGFYRKKFDAANVELSTANPTLTVAGGDPALVTQFKTSTEVNRVLGSRMIFAGDNAIYESVNRGDNLTALRNSDTTLVGKVDEQTGCPIAYGGTFNSVANPDVLYLGTGSGNEAKVKLRSTAGSPPVDTAYAGYGTSDIVVNRADWHDVYVSGYFDVYHSTDAGVTWTTITGNLQEPSAGIIRTIEFIRLNGVDCVVVGADLGVFCSFVNDLGNWQRLGTGLPGVITFDMQYSAADKVLVLSTLGRGVWQLSTVAPVALAGAVSRKVHGGAGTFDIDLVNGTSKIECRSGGATGDFTIVLSFANSLTSVGGTSVTGGTGSVSSSFIDGGDAHNYIVNLTGVTNAQTSTITLANVSDSAGNNSPTVPIALGVLLGDTTGNGQVSGSDVSQAKSAAQTGAVIAGTFRSDVNLNGTVNATDVSVVKSTSGTTLP